MVNKKRYEFVDLTKGFCMLFVMSIHLSKELVFSNIYIESFRMPCYFFICWVFFSTKYPFQVF